MQSQIEDALKGEFDETIVRGQPSPEVKALRDRFRKLKQKAYQYLRDDAQLQRIVEKINEIEDKLDVGVFTLNEKGEKIPERADISEARKRYNELKRLMNTNAAITDLSQQLKTGDYKISALRAGS